MAIQDVIRDEAYGAISEMLKLKLDLTMCTGDIQTSAEHIVAKLIKKVPGAKSGDVNINAGMKPEGKQIWVK